MTHLGTARPALFPPPGPQVRSRHEGVCGVNAVTDLAAEILKLSTPESFHWSHRLTLPLLSRPPYSTSTQVCSLALTLPLICERPRIVPD